VQDLGFIPSTTKQNKKPECKEEKKVKFSWEQDTKLMTIGLPGG
jgi:hypothetical protein